MSVNLFFIWVASIFGGILLIGVLGSIQQSIDKNTKAITSGVYDIKRKLK
jgi:hypothetical protein